MTVLTRLSAGARFAEDYRIISVLSEGGMGSVYVAEQLSTGKRRALKLMLPELVQDARLRARFEQEARVGSLIESEHVVEVVAAGVFSGTPWLAMELLDGLDLGKWRTQRPSIALTDVRSVLAELCHAVGAAHAKGLVHRDLKPENVFVAQSKRLGSPFIIKVLDFGIAKLVDEARSTKTAAVGTPLWMAPEQTEASSDVFPATDVWAIGLIAFWLLTGKIYWRGGNTESVSLGVLMREIVLDPLVPASQRASEFGLPHALPHGFDNWFAHAVKRDPRARFADARAAFTALDPLLSAAAPHSGARSQPPVPSYGAAYAPANTPQNQGYVQPFSMPLAQEKKGLGCWVRGLLVMLVGDALGAGACIGGSVWYVTAKQTTCEDLSNETSDRLEACEVACTPTDPSTAKYCVMGGDLYAAQGDVAKALIKYDAACQFDHDSCTKAASLRATRRRRDHRLVVIPKRATEAT